MIPAKFKCSFGKTGQVGGWGEYVLEGKKSKGVLSERVYNTEY